MGATGLTTVQFADKVLVSGLPELKTANEVPPIIKTFPAQSGQTGINEQTNPVL